MNNDEVLNSSASQVNSQKATCSSFDDQTWSSS